MIISNIKIEDTYAEAFEGVFCRAIITADDERTLRSAAHDVTATPSAVIGRIEGGMRNGSAKTKPLTNAKARWSNGGWV